MDSPELLPCFCGGVATPDAGNYGRKCQCSNENCALYMRELYPQDWNSLQSEIATVSDARVAAARADGLKAAADLIRCDCCDFCGESPDYQSPCANVLATRIDLLAAGQPSSMQDARDHLSALTDPAP